MRKCYVMVGEGNGEEGEAEFMEQQYKQCVQKCCLLITVLYTVFKL